MLKEIETALAELFDVKLSKAKQPNLSTQYKTVALKNSDYFLHLNKSLDDKSITKLKTHLEPILNRLGQLEAIAAHSDLNTTPQELVKSEQGNITTVIDVDRESELTAIFNAFSDGYFRLDAAGTILDFKVPDSYLIPQDIVGKSIQEIAPNKEVNRNFAKAIEQINKTNSVISIEYPITFSNRNYYHLARLIPIQEKQIAVVVRDITEKKRVEDALLQSEKRFRALFEAAPDGITILNEKGLIIECNPATLRLYDLPLEKVIGRYITDFVTPSFKKIFKEMSPQMRQLKAREREVQVLKSNGDVRDVWRKSMPIIDSEGNLNNLVYDRDITLKKQTETAVQDSERRYRLLAENTADIIWTMDMNLGFTYISPSIEQAQGYNEEEAMALVLQEYLPPASFEKAITTFAEVLATLGNMALAERQQFSQTMELENICKDGSIIPVEINVSMILDLEGNPVGIIGTTRNIAERKKAEVALRQSEEQFRMLFETAPDGITVLDDKGFIVDCNPATLRLYARSSKQIIGQHITQFLAPSSKHIFKEVASQLRQLNPQERELQIVAANGDLVDLWRKGTPIIDANGDFNGILIYDRDITQQNEVITSLAESELKLRRLTDNISDMIAQTDQYGIIQYSSPSYARFLGYRSEEVIDTSIFEYVHPDDINGVLKQFAEGMKVGHGQSNFRMRDKNNQYKQVSSKGTAIKESDGTIIGAVFVARDISERLKAEEELRVRHKQQKILNALLQIGFNDMPLGEQLALILQEILAIPWLPLTPQGGIFLVEDESKVLTLVVQQNLSPAIQTMCSQVPFGRCLCGQAAATRQIVFANCVDDRHENQYEGIKPHGHYNIPLLFGQEVLGVIVLYLPEGHQKSDNEVAFLDAVANVIAGIIKRKQVEEQLRIKRRQADTLRMATQVLSSTLELPLVFELILAELEQVVPYDTVAVQQIKGELLEIISCRGFANPEDVIGSSFDFIKVATPNCQVAKTGVPQILHDPAAAFPKFYAEHHGSDVVTSWLGVPLLFGNKPIGMIAFNKRKSNFYTQEHMELAMAFAAQAAVAIDNARLFYEAQQAKEVALEASRLKSHILATVNHDLRTPLGAILGYTELFLRGLYGPLSDRQQEIMGRVMDSTQYLTDLVNELLDGAQLEAGRLTLNIESFSLTEMIHRVESRMSTLVQSKKLALTFEINSDVPDTLSGDEKRLQRILLNIVENAIKFTQTGGVQVSVYCPDSTRWAMEIADTGSGIPLEAQTYIFEAFQQVDDPLTQTHSGLGLGLAISKQLIELMGGEIMLESEIGKGSVFTILLPLTSGETSGATAHHQ